MKFVRIKRDGHMCEHDVSININNIRKIMREISGINKIQQLYEWSYEDSIIQCYGYIEGKPGTENKHDLPTSGKKLIEYLDNSDTQLLFNDIYLIRLENKKYLDFDVSDSDSANAQRDFMSK